MVVRQGRESYAASRRQPARARSRRAIARAQISYTMPSDTHTQNEMMSQLEALEEALTDNCSVSGGDDSSVIGPEMLYFDTEEQITKVITNVINTHRDSTVEVDKSSKYPEGIRKFGTLSLNNIANRELLVVDMTAEVQRVLRLDLETRRNKADIARNDAAQKFNDLAEGLIPIVAELFRIEKDRSVSLSETSGRVKTIRGLSGLSPEEETAKWEKSRADALIHYTELARSEKTVVHLYNKSSDLTNQPVGATAESLALQQLQIKTVNSQLTVANSSAEHHKEAIFAAVSQSGNGKSISKNTLDTPPFPVPVSLLTPLCEKRKEILNQIADWATKDSVIKHFYLVIPDLLYMIHSCDASEAVHIMPPDYVDTWVEPKIAFKLQSQFKETTRSVVGAFMKAKHDQWKTLFEMISKSVICKDVGNWIDTAHVVGQFEKKSVNMRATDQFDGRKMLWTMLGQLVSFTAASQQAAISSLHQLHQVWSTKKPQEALATIAAEVAAAKEQGVAVDYKLMFAPLARVIADSSATFAPMYSRLVEAKLTADTVVNHDEFDADDIGHLLHDLCAVALRVISESNTADDAKRGTKRSQQAMSAAVGATGGSDDEFAQRIRNLSYKRKYFQGSDSDITAQALDLVAKGMSPFSKDDTICERIEACQLILESGKTLDDKALRKKTSALRAGSGKGNSKAKGKGKGQKGGQKGGKGGKSSKAVSSGRVDNKSSSGGQEKQYCNTKNCKNDVSWSSRFNAYFEKCYPCSQQSPNAMAVDIETQEVEVTLNGIKTVHQLDANSVSLMEALRNGGTITVPSTQNLTERVLALS